jgi:hypothetical protein
MREKLPVPGFQYGVNAKSRRIIGKFADSGELAS